MNEVIKLNEAEMTMLKKAFAAYKEMRFQELNLRGWTSNHPTKGKTYNKHLVASETAHTEFKTWERALHLINERIGNLNFVFAEVYENMLNARHLEPDFSEKFALAA